MSSEWMPYGSDDPLKAEIKREVIQDLDYRQALTEFQRQAQELYLQHYPQHREVFPLVQTTAGEYLAEHPEFRPAGVPREKVAEVIKEIGTRVDQRLTATSRSSGGREEDWRDRRIRDTEDTDENREQAIRDEAEAKAKLREPL